MKRLFNSQLFFALFQVVTKSYIKYKYDVTIGRNAYLNFRCGFEGNNTIGHNVEFTNSYMGFASYISNNSVISHTMIGRYCAIGSNVQTCLGVHPTKKFVSIHPCFYSKKKQAGFTLTPHQLFDEHKYVDNEKKYVVEIGNDVWIGNNVSILDGIKIADGAVIGFGSLITNDIEPYTMVAGVPGKIIGHRFTAKQREALLKFKWWDKDFLWIKKHSKLFEDIEKYMEFFMM